MKKVMIILLMFVAVQTYAGTSKNRPTLPRDPKIEARHDLQVDARPKRGNAPWPIPF